MKLARSLWLVVSSFKLQTTHYALRTARQQRANAVLFSLIIIASAMVISLGMVSLVANEARSVGLVLPAERAYYKAESYIEQGLWQKKQNPNYQVTKKEDVPANYLCDPAGCDPFTTNPKSQSQLLKEFFATTSPPEDEVGLRQDVPVQLDIDTAGVSTTGGSVTLSDIAGENGYKGIEVTIIAYPKSQNTTPQFPIDDPTTTQIEQATTPVFIDKKFIAPTEKNPAPIQINTSAVNPLGENYPALDSTNTYRLRLKALGAGATTKVAASSTNGVLKLISPDFTVRSVAQDANSRRGLQVLLPASEQTASIFDFVLFSDLDLDKVRLKVAGTTTKTFTTRIIRDLDQDCQIDAGEVGIPNTSVSLSPGYADKTDNNGNVTFTNLQPGTTYTATTPSIPGGEFCPPGNQRTFTFSSGTQNENMQYTGQPADLKPAFLVRTPLPARVPLYRLWNPTINDHFYTMNVDEWTQKKDLIANISGYNQEFIAGYVYRNPVAGTSPLYRLWWPAITDHYYLMDQAIRDALVQFFGLVGEGTAGNIYPYTGSCPAGSTPLYQSYNSPLTDHFYTLSTSEWDAAAAIGWTKDGIAGCAWTTP